ncbi:AtpZ/AtpI family protein [Psychroserpens sp. NJDZ02]|uniref:AtpZ/AtpI family protein n=1 Tax=Psychroserpens sp. NJDZ02 TaxID=2570561 RepID=UPI001F10CE0E|nr:AtpZ/AtpI family protein [Psychroserpens sp. NJDZ02]
MARKPKKQLNPYIRFTSIALQMGITIWLGSILGNWLDLNYSTNQFYFKTITLLAVFVAMYSVIKQVVKITNDQNSKNE